MTLSALSLASPPHRPIIVRVEGDELVDVDDRWPEHWDILLIDGGARTRHMVLDNREIDNWITPYIDNGYEVLGYPPATQLPYIALDREMRVVEQIPGIVSRYLDGTADAVVIGELQGDVYFDRGTIAVSIDKAALVELIGLERGEAFLVAIDQELRITITPSDPLDGLVHHAVQAQEFSETLRFSRKTRPGDWIPELTYRTLRFDVRDDRSLVSEPVLQDAAKLPAPPPLTIPQRLSLASPVIGDFAILPLIILLGALG